MVAAAERSGAWLLADEVYAGAERVTDEFTQTFYGQYERVLAIGSISKAYGLPGLRIGWVVGPADIVARMWAWQDYIAICTTCLGNKLAAVALSPGRASADPRAHARLRAARLRERGALGGGRDDVEVLPPDAAAICFVKYAQQDQLDRVRHAARAQKSAFVAPGDLFGLDGHLRVSFGLPDEYVREGLVRIGELLDEIA